MTSSTRYVLLAANPEEKKPEEKKPAQAPLEKKEKPRLKSDLFFPRVPEPDTHGYHDHGFQVTSVFSAVFDNSSFRQAPSNFICCSRESCDTFGNNTGAPEQHNYARSFRRSMLECCETPLHATNYCIYKYCYPENNQYNKKTLCLDLTGCLCLCCIVRTPTYVLKTVGCCFAGAAGFVVDQLPCASQPGNAPTLQTMDDMARLIHKHKELMDQINYQKRDDFFLVVEKDKKPCWKNAAGLEKEGIGLEELIQNEQVYDEQITSVVARFLNDKFYRQDLAVSRHAWGQKIRPEDLAWAVVEHHGKQPISISARIQVLSYLWEYGFNFVHEKLFLAALPANYANAEKILEFILCKIYPVDFSTLNQMLTSDDWRSNRFKVLLVDLFAFNPDRAARKALMLQQHGITTPKIIEFSEWLNKRTAFEMGRHHRLGAKSTLFKLPAPIFKEILSFYDGIKRQAR
jgi:hypothetical protein